MPTDIQQRVLEAFQQEHREHIAAMREILRNWPNLSREELEEVFRLAHSLKGGARVSDLPDVETVTHHAEQILAEILKGKRSANPELRADLESILATVEDYMAALAAGVPATLPPAMAERFGIPATAPHSPSIQAASAATTRSAPSAPDVLRLRAANLDRLLRSSGQVLSEAVRQSQRGSQLREMVAELQELQKLCERPDAEVPLDALRSRLPALGREARRMLSAQQQSARALRVLGEQLQGDVRQARMVPVGSIFEGFAKMVRDAAREQGKEVEFIERGMEIEADRMVLQALKDPVMHALRNAVSHGIATEAGPNVAAESARVSLTAIVRSNQLVLRVEDNGRGLDYTAIRRRAIEAGIFSEAEGADWTESELSNLLFRPAFSTQRSVTALSGQGMGLSVVREAVDRLQGSVHFESLGGGTALIIEVPLSAATHRLLLAKDAGTWYAFPASSVARLARVPANAVQATEGKSRVWLDGEAVLLTSLGVVFSRPEAALVSSGGYLSILLLSAAGMNLAVGVDGFGRELNTFVSPIPAPASASPYFSGGVVLEDGTPVLIINPFALLERCKGGTVYHRASVLPASATLKKPLVLVVDDSFTARTLQKNILETAGYEVRTAVDGMQGLATLRAAHFDAVVADVQMPRMDGFRMLEEIKRDERLRELPVVLVTSLNSEEDQARGLSLGARAYLVKQKFDHRELLETVKQLL